MASSKKSKKQKIFARDGHQCVYCGSKGQLTLDHIVPESWGGTRAYGNLVTACYSCNTKRGTMMPPPPMPFAPEGFTLPELPEKNPNPPIPRRPRRPLAFNGWGKFKCTGCGELVSAFNKECPRCRVPLRRRDHYKSAKEKTNVQTGTEEGDC